MNLGELARPYGAKKRRKIVGRGRGSGHGKTSTRGQKGQRARSGRGPILGFEGGQAPLIRIIPKRGFNAPVKKEYQIVNIRDITKLSSDGFITPEILLEKGIIATSHRPVKILGHGKVTKPLIVKAHAFSSAAKELIEKAGGKVECLKP